MLLVLLQDSTRWKHKTVLAADELAELQKREAEQGITPNAALEAFMKAETRQGQKESIVTDLVIKMLGLNVRAPLA